MAVNRDKRAVGSFPNFEALIEALKALQANGFSLDKVSVIAKQADDQTRLNRMLGSDVIGHQADLGAKREAATGGTLGILAGLLVGIGALSIPTIGSGMLAGATANTLATTLPTDAVGAVTEEMIGELIALGIPEEQANIYYERVERGEFLLLLEVSSFEAYRIETILKSFPVQKWAIYQAPIDQPVRLVSRNITAVQ